MDRVDSFTREEKGKQREREGSRTESSVNRAYNPIRQPPDSVSLSSSSRFVRRSREGMTKARERTSLPKRAYMYVYMWVCECARVSEEKGSSCEGDDQEEGG